MTPKIGLLMGIVLVGIPGRTLCSPSKVNILDSLAAARTNKNIQMILYEEEMVCARQEIQTQSEYNARIVGRKIKSKQRIAKIGEWSVLYKESTYKIPRKYFTISYAPDSLYMWKVYVKQADSIIVDHKSRNYPAWIGLNYNYSEQAFEVARGIKKNGEKTWRKVNVKRIPKRLQFEICSTQPADAVIAPMEVFLARPDKTYRTLIMPNYRTYDGANGEQSRIAHNRYGGLIVSAEHHDSNMDSLYIFIEKKESMTLGIGMARKCISIENLDSLCFEHKSNKYLYAK